ncbi:MAG TPA: thiolase family protein [Candidatus Polarisedimenticolia bacterium]|nr:thiolase family protein [Candidatus Polarisedimenticolia bacterium]
MDRQAVFLSGAVRTPIGRFGGSFRAVPAPRLGAAAARAALVRSGRSPDEIQETVFGCARQAGVGPNPARQIAHLAGIPDRSPAYTVNQACASGLKAILLAARAVGSAESDPVLAGGVENMSRVPYLVESLRFGGRMGHAEVTDGMIRDGFLCPLCGQLMGETAENLVKGYGISREEQDRYAAESQQRYQRARDRGIDQEEIVPVEIEGPRGTVLRVEADEHPRNDVTIESLARLSPVYGPGGTITAGSASGITDGGAALIVSGSRPEPSSSSGPVARLTWWTSVGVEPARMGIGPVPAIRRLLSETGLSLDRIDLVELNEAFAGQVLACQRELRIDPDRLNPNGGAIAMGHPIGCSGARIVVTLIHEMARRKARYGIAALCVSGGMGVAALLEPAA